MKKNSGSDLKVNKLLDLVKQYDEVREKQVAKQNRKIEACEAKVETFLKNNLSTPSSPSLDPSTPSFSPRVQTPPIYSALQGKPLHYALPAVPFPVQAPTAEQIAAMQMSLTGQVAALQMNLNPYQFPMYAYSKSNTTSGPMSKSEEKEETETLCIDGTQYGTLVGTGGKKIDSIRDQSKANITIKYKKDKPPHMYYEVQMKGTKEAVDEAKALVMKAIYIPPR